MAGNGGAGAAVELLRGYGDLGIDAAADDLTPDMFEPADLPGLPLEPVERPAGGKGGRPPGATNKLQRKMADYILSRYRSPLIGQAELWSRKPAQLAEEMGLYRYVQVGSGEHTTIEKVLDIHEAVKIQLQAMRDALPYLHQKLPLALEVKSEQLGIMMIQGFQGHGDGPPRSGGLPIVEHEENQGFSEPSAPQSHAPQSHEDANARGNNDDPAI